MPKGKRLSGGHAQLPFDKIHACHHFGDGMLDLKAGVHLQKIDVQVPVGDELHRPCVPVADGARRLERIIRQFLADGRRHDRARRFFDYFLPPPLCGAIAFVKMNDVAMRIAEHLHFEMTGMLYQSLQHKPVIVECVFGLSARCRKLIAKLAGASDRSNPPATSTAHRFNEEGETKLPGLNPKPLVGLILSKIARHARHTCRLHQRLCGGFVAHLPDDIGGRAYEDNSSQLARLGEVRVFREEAIARMDGVRSSLTGGFENGADIEIAVLRWRRSDSHRLIRHAQVHGLCIGIGENRHGPIAHAFCRARDPAGNLPAVGDQNFLKRPARNHNGFAAVSASKPYLSRSCRSANRGASPTPNGVAIAP